MLMCFPTFFVQHYYYYYHQHIVDMCSILFVVDNEVKNKDHIVIHFQPVAIKLTTLKKK